jgi:uncharacterized protein
MRRLLPTVLSFALTLFAARADSLVGRWTGTWTKVGDSLPVTLTFSAGPNGLGGFFDSDALQVAGIPFRDITVNGNAVHFTLPSDNATAVFDGSLSGGALDGRLTEGTVEGLFHLVRSNQPAPVLAMRDVQFANGSVTIAGSVIAPSGPGLHPAIMFLHGSGPEGRWANRWLAQKFAAAGFVALITDKRGVGASTGNWQEAGFEELASDAQAAIRFLAQQPGVDARRIGIYGHSQGGTIAPLVASLAPVAFIIASAPGAVDPAELEEYSVGNAIGIGALPHGDADDARLFVRTIVDVAYRGHPRAELDAVAARFRTRSWYFDPPPADNFYWRFAARIAGYRPAFFWSRVRVPVLLVYGDKDKRVPPGAIDAAVHALRQGGNHRPIVQVFVNADHNFNLPQTEGGWPKRAAGYAERLTAWAQSVQ